MPHWLFPSQRRATEATMRELVATGAAGGGAFAVDPIDGDTGWTQLGQRRRELPTRTREMARDYSIAAYRSNPMARAIIDTYVSFAVGDSGVSIVCPDPAVRAVVDRWWQDPRNQFTAGIVPTMVRDWMLLGEAAYEYMVGERTGVVRWAPKDPSQVRAVVLDRGNPLWPKQLLFDVGAGSPLAKDIAQVDDMSGLRAGDIGWFPGWRTLLTDTRGQPFLQPILDDLDGYSMVLSNLIDRTAIARYLMFDVTISGGQKEVEDFIARRGGQHAPPAGSVEVHNEGVKWEAVTADTGSFEDSNTLGTILTNVAGGTGLAKTWLADAEGANRATSLSMAEPVRRRVGGVQAGFLAVLTEMARFAVDRAVAAGRLPRLIQIPNAAGEMTDVPPSSIVNVAGPEIAAADSQVTAAVFLNLSSALDNMVASGALTIEAARLAAQKAWEQFTGLPFRPDLAAKVEQTGAASADDLAQEADRATASGVHRRLSGDGLHVHLPESPTGAPSLPPR